MQDHAKLQRLLQALMYLKCRYGRKIDEIADYFDVSIRTVYRYLETIRETGFLIEYKHGYYKIISETTAYRDLSELLHFSSEESYLLQKAIHTIDENNLLKENLIRKLYSLYDSRNIAETITKNQLSENVHLLCDAIEKKQQVVLKDYRSANSKKISDRLVEPFLFTTNYVSVWCYDVNKKQNRLFKTIRVAEVEKTNQNWEYGLKHQATPIDVFRMAMKKPMHVKVLLSLRARNLLVEEYPLSEAYIKQVNDDYVFDGPVGSYQGIGRFVLGLIDEVEILETDDLIGFIKKKLNFSKFQRNDGY